MARRRRQSDGHNPDNSVLASQDLEETFASAACEQCRTRKVRCDRQIPQCSNCEKAGVSCDFPSCEKRVNHVKKLVEDVSGLASRLDGIDQAMNKVVQHLSTLQSKHSRPATTPSSRLSMGLKPESPLVSDAEDMEAIFYAKSPAEANGDSFKSPNNQPRDHIATRLLFDDSRRTLGMLLERLKYSSATCGLFQAAKVSAVEFELRIKYELYPQFHQSNLPLSAGDKKRVALPPRPLLDTCISDFFEFVNPTTPLFSESHFTEAMDVYYAKACKLDEAYHLCFNNIIILALGLRTRLGRFDKTKMDGMSDDLLPSFLRNSFRALHRLSVFMQPRLICCQALATLAMVVREYHEGKAFDIVCHTASLISKSIGLGQCNREDETSNEERRDLYWTIFAMDKQRTYVTGQPFDLHFYDSDVRLLQTTMANDLVQQGRKAHIHMMAIWEDIYIHLYSLRALRSSSTHRQYHIAKLDRLCRDWYFRHSALLTTRCNTEMSALECWHIELKYAFHIGQILVHRRSSEECSQQVALDNSRAALQIIRHVFQSKHSKGSVWLLSKLFRHYPLVSIHGLFSSFLANPTAELLEDLGLIEDVAEALDILCEHNIPTACLFKVNEGIQWYRQVAKVFRNLFECSNYRVLKSSSTRAAKRLRVSDTQSGSQGQNEVHFASQKRSNRPVYGDIDDFLATPKGTNNNFSGEILGLVNSVQYDTLTTSHNHPATAVGSYRNELIQPSCESDDDLAKFLQDTLPLPSSCMGDSLPQTQTQCSNLTPPGTSMPLLAVFPSILQGDCSGVAQDDMFYQCLNDPFDLWGANPHVQSVPDEFFL